MTTKTSPGLIGPVVLALGLAFAASAAAGPFRVGAAQVDITPKNGTPMAGFYSFRPAGGVADPLYAKTLVVEQDGSHVAMIVLDMVTTTQPIVAAARKLIAEQCGIAGDRVMISATHTHTGPVLPRGSLMDEITKANSAPSIRYVDALPALIAQSVVQAKASLTPAQPAYAVGNGQGISFNRRVLRQGSGKAIWQPKKIDPATERPAGPVDPDVGVLVFQSEGSPVAAYLNFAMHPTSMGKSLSFSADYPGAFTKLVTEQHGVRLVSLCANGCCGNLNQGDYFTGKNRNTQEIAAALAAAVKGAWAGLKPLHSTAPRALSTRVTLPRPTFGADEIAKAKDTVARMATGNFGTVPLAEAVCIMETLDKKDVPLIAEVQAIAFSDELAIVSLPGEIFVELGLALKKASPFKHTLIAELANGSIGYVPNREAYPQGNYEVVSARGAAGSGELLVEAALKLLHDLAKS
jgi:neutral ceramidase